MSAPQLAQAFWTHDAFKWDPLQGFRLASGATSPFYVDCRGLLAHPASRWLVAKFAFSLVHKLDIQTVGGLEIGAISLGTAISDFAYTANPSQILRTFVVRKQPKDHGLVKLLEGAIRPGDRALIVDDVLTSGGSLIKAIHAAREAHLTVEQALVIVDREEQNGKGIVEEEGVTLFRLLTLEDLKTAKPK